MSRHSVKSSDDNSPIDFSDYNYSTLVRHQTADNVLDIEETLSAYEKAKVDLYRKKLELELLETFALYSNEPSIINIRKQLFTMVKLTYGDKISDIVEDQLGREGDNYALNSSLYDGSVSVSRDKELTIYQKIRLRISNGFEKLSANASNWRSFLSTRETVRNKQKQIKTTLGT